jgi:putative flippase GtrA
VRNRAAEFGYFVVLGVAGLAVNSVVILVAVGTLGLKIVMAKALAAVCTFATNFTLRRQFLFRPRVIA